MFGVIKGKMPRRNPPVEGVSKVVDPHHPRGFREVCTKAGWAKRRIERAELAGYKCECTMDATGKVIGCGANAAFGDAHHVDERKHGGGSRDDHIDNLRWVLPGCHRNLHVPPKVVPAKE